MAPPRRHVVDASGNLCSRPAGILRWPLAGTGAFASPFPPQRRPHLREWELQHGLRPAGELPEAATSRFDGPTARPATHATREATPATAGAVSSRLLGAGPGLYEQMASLPPQLQMFMRGCPEELEDKRHRINCRELVMRNLLALSAGVRRTVCWNLAPDIPRVREPAVDHGSAVRQARVDGL
jgi:hypothetical protein